MEQACRVLKISRSGCYGWAQRNPGARERRNQALRRRLMEPHQNDLALDSLCHPPKPEFGCSCKRVPRQIWLAGIASVEKPGLQSHHRLPAQPPRRPHSKETSFLSNPIRPGWVISPAFPPERVGSIRPSSRAYVPAKGWAVPFPVLLIPRRLWKRWTG